MTNNVQKSPNYKHPQNTNILKSQNPNANKHPENPQILDILIQTINIPKPKRK
ncbi:hypothetical protein MEO39_22080 [Dolichospermum sp. ST_sed2]|nr:hypothetical protein [Dolichospermum sp. ST_sed8]MDD1457331.1 hypothetical protein [Dolichospermum sp. ST_sed7]MDD1462711.1 hypothetical protein [Dolichospermum sp. ST_sed2]MDD1473894.1 hypothetical protein [Dolichospermum sp. ST_sed4]